MRAKRWSDTFFPTQRDNPQAEAVGNKVSDPRTTADSRRAGSLSTWAMLLKRIFGVDPLECPECGGRMKIISFIERRQHEVIERILRHCALTPTEGKKTGKRRRHTPGDMELAGQQ
jgi:hypothetical protein